ncbi:MAG: PAS domain-containing protein [Spirochaetaceae bacterium]|jgi:iron only hydrogenase large subunit-like protein|nr:PAS domain-containing protein [Spirochaetaceae bacterium]
MDYPVYTNTAKCRACYKCLSRCPVKAIRVEGGMPNITAKMCVFCGKCVTSCAAQAKCARGDLDQARRLFQPGVKVFASLAPSFPAEFCECSPAQLIAALKRLGFYGVSETALGADFVSAAIACDLQAGAGKKDCQKLFLSSACPAVVLYIKRYAPAFVPYLEDRASPLLAHATFLRHHYGKKTAVVFIGPCIAKKREADQFKEINSALTFDELKRWFAEAGIEPEKIPESECAGADFVPRRAAGGSFFPVDGGMLIALRKYHGFSKTSNMVISGLDTIAEVLNRDTFAYSTLEAPLFLELLACQGGCVNGPCITRDASAINRRARLLSYAESADNVLDAETAASDIPLTGTLVAVEMPKSKSSPSELRAALAQLGKFGKEDELNCSACGYESCRAFAEALLDARVEKTLCASYTRSLVQRKANALIKAMPSGIVIADKHCHIIECNRKFAVLLGSEIEELYEISPSMTGFDLFKMAGLGQYFKEAFAMNAEDGVDFEFRHDGRIFHLNIFEIERGETLAGVLEDITKPQTRRDNTVARAKKIIDKNVKSVQKIAFLLGENAAETEAILNSIIESYTAGKPKK